MRRTIKGQIIASTHDDRHGPGISPERLRTLASQILDGTLISVEHDPRRPPTARLHEARIVELDDGELAIKCDIEVLDESQYSKLRGFSISFSDRVDANDREGVLQEVAVAFNPLQVSEDSVREILAADSLGSKAALCQRFDKSIVAPAIIIWVIVSKGFWDEAGADLYRFFKRLVRGALARDDEERPVEGAISIGSTDASPDLVLMPSIEPENEAIRISTDEVLESARSMAPDTKLQKIVARIDSSGRAEIDFVVTTDGDVIRNDHPSDSPTNSESDATK